MSVAAENDSQLEQRRAEHSSAQAPSRLSIFISYSRADEGFADELVEGLDYANIDVSIDRHSIREGEEWRSRLDGLISDADAVVFLLSPDSARSSTCDWEVEHAYRLGKRIIPVLWRPLDGVAAPEKLASLNYVRFDEHRSFMVGLKRLVAALTVDLDWLREHTRILSRAREWEESGRSANRLLVGEALAEANGWAERRPKDAPPTSLCCSIS